MTEISGLLQEGDLDYSSIKCPNCKDTRFVMWKDITMDSNYIEARFTCTTCKNLFTKTIEMEVITRNIPKQILLITEAKD